MLPLRLHVRCCPLVGCSQVCLYACLEYPEVSLPCSVPCPVQALRKQGSYVTFCCCKFSIFCCSIDSLDPIFSRSICRITRKPQKPRAKPLHPHCHLLSGNLLRTDLITPWRPHLPAYPRLAPCKADPTSSQTGHLSSRSSSNQPHRFTEQLPSLPAYSWLLSHCLLRQDKLTNPGMHGDQHLQLLDLLVQRLAARLRLAQLSVGCLCLLLRLLDHQILLLQDLLHVGKLLSASLKRIPLFRQCIHLYDRGPQQSLNPCWL